MYKVHLKKSAYKELDKLQNNTQKRVARAIDELEVFNPHSTNIKKLLDPLCGYRKRVGNYRILFDVLDGSIIIYKITKRADAYK